MKATKGQADGKAVNAVLDARRAAAARPAPSLTASGPGSGSAVKRSCQRGRCSLFTDGSRLVASRSRHRRREDHR